jgi:replicative DNA helicase
MGQLLGVPTGFPKLDKITSGLQASDLIILAARPGMGKTSLALNIAMHAAKAAQAQVMIFSLEMGAVQLGNRLLASEAGVDSYEIRDGSVYKKNEDVIKIVDASETLSAASIFIDSTSGISINEIKNKCRRKKAKNGLDLVVVDYLQLMDFGGSGKASARPENRQQEVATLSRMLKQLAREMECPFIVLSQLSRAVEQRGGHKPVLADLRESGAIEQDADIVMFIYQKEKKDDDSEGDPEDVRRLYIAKHRNGETGEIQVRWIGKYTKFGHYNPDDDVRNLV